MRSVAPLTTTHTLLHSSFAAAADRSVMCARPCGGVWRVRSNAAQTCRDTHCADLSAGPTRE